MGKCSLESCLWVPGCQNVVLRSWDQPHLGSFLDRQIVSPTPDLPNQKHWGPGLASPPGERECGRGSRQVFVFLLSPIMSQGSRTVALSLTWELSQTGKALTLPPEALICPPVGEDGAQPQLL